MDFGQILEAVRLPKTIKIGINFGIDFWKALKWPGTGWRISREPRTFPLRTPEDVLTGLQDWRGLESRGVKIQWTHVKGHARKLTNGTRWSAGNDAADARDQLHADLRSSATTPA